MLTSSYWYLIGKTWYTALGILSWLYRQDLNQLIVFQDLKGALIFLKHFILSNWRVGVPELSRTLHKLSKSSSKFLVSPSIDNRTADGVQAPCQVEYNELNILSLWRHAKKTEACHDQQRNDTEKADGYNNGECAGAFHFALDGSHSRNVTQFSDLFSVPLGHNKGVAVESTMIIKGMISNDIIKKTR